jgi:transporter family protein
MKGVLFACMAAFFWGSSAILIKKASEQGDLLLGTYVTLLANMAVVVSTVLATQDLSIFLKLSTRSLLFFLTIAMMNYLVGRTLYYQSIRHIGASRAASIEGLEPVFAAIFAVFFLGEILSLRVLAGTVLVLSGLGLLLTENPMAKRGAIPPPNQGNILKGRVFAILTAIAWGLVPTLLKLALGPKGSPEHVPAPVALLVCLLFGMVIYTAFLTIRGGLARPYNLRRRGLLLFLFSGMVSSLAQLSYFTALEAGRALVVVPIQSSHRLFTLAFSYLLIQQLERVNSRLVLAGCLTVFGVVVISMDRV